MFVNGMGVGSMVCGLVATGFRCFGGVGPTALGALDTGVSTVIDRVGYGMTTYGGWLLNIHFPI